ncbi:hypothetical protein Pla108_10550 [Botrimarina colliarenosi]|uniref:Rod shape-determining protein MreD n=1 Tax=Botrimarina colliarenosi TaxID=2528001 RepID=A0A5C6AL28_9BACT|nr:DUF6580 family putative transport protein [Botrimarina colliarenosi]TWU00111.1 hypothetical protein Pla108_10550 [Botrimarina colliarenosi]
MSTPRRSPLSDTLPTVATFVLLVTIGVVGRWGQPDWCVTPLAAVGLLAGYALPRRWAIATPLTAMLISDAMLPSYGSLGVAVAVYAAMATAPLLGSLLRRPLPSRSAGLARLTALSLTPAMVFFFTTNFAVWAFQSHYAKTAAGLAECYLAALPFLRRMLAGDAAFVAVLFGAAALAGAFSLTGAKCRETTRPAQA